MIVGIRKPIVIPKLKSGGIRNAPNGYITSQMNKLIIDFYQDDSPDNEGRYLENIINWNDTQLEECHSFIQWLFPLVEPSRFNPDAPLLDEETILAFNKQPNAKRHLNFLKSYYRMIIFFDLTETHMKLADAAETKPWFARPLDHNFMRITRMLTSMRLLGFDSLLEDFWSRLEWLYAIAPDEVGTVTYKFWKDAAGK